MTIRYFAGDSLTLCRRYPFFPVENRTQRILVGGFSERWRLTGATACIWESEENPEKARNLEIKSLFVNELQGFHKSKNEVSESMQMCGCAFAVGWWVGECRKKYVALPTFATLIRNHNSWDPQIGLGIEIDMHTTDTASWHGDWGRIGSLISVHTSHDRCGERPLPKISKLMALENELLFGYFFP